MSEFYRLRFSTTLAKIKHSDWSARMALFDNKQDDGIDDRTLFGKVWEQTKVTTRLVVSYFNWIWQHSRFKSTAAQRAGLTSRSWTWSDIATYPTIIWRTTKAMIDLEQILQTIASCGSKSSINFQEFAEKLGACITRCWDVPPPDAGRYGRNFRNQTIAS